LKRSAHIKSASPVIVYEIREEQKGHGVVFRQGEVTGGSGPNLHLAANVAIVEARQEAASTRAENSRSFHRWTGTD
jgi:hypothetical protein